MSKLLSDIMNILKEDTPLDAEVVNQGATGAGNAVDGAIPAKQPETPGVAEETQTGADHPHAQVAAIEAATPDDGAIPAEETNNDWGLKESKEDVDAQAAIIAICEAKIDTEVFGKLFEGTDFSDEFKEKVVTIFEASVKERVKGSLRHALSLMEANYESRVARYETQLNEAMQKYADEIAKEWLVENKIAIQSGLRFELLESLESALKSVLVEHYVDVPEEKLNVIESLTKKVEKLEENVTKEMEGKITLREENQKLRRELAIESYMKNVSPLQVEKLRSLVEGVEYVNEADFKKKMDILKENLKTPAKTGGAALLEDVTPASKTVETVTEDPFMAAAVRALSKK